MIEKQDLNIDIEDNSYEDNKDNTYKSKIIDVLKEQYFICCDAPLPEFSNIFCKAYKVKFNNSDNNLYALVYTNSLPIRLSIIESLKHHAINNIMSPIDYGIVKISETNKEQFVVILKTPDLMTLYDYAKEQGSFNNDFIIQVVLISICKILQELHSQGIIHGNINPKNIYINPDTKKIVLGNCINGSSGFAQNIIFESLERAECLQMITKGEGAEHTDYFALGVICLYLLFVKDFDFKQTDELLNRRFIYGSYKVYTKGHSIPMSMRPLIKGLVNDDLEKRWKYQDIMDWYNRKQLGLVESEIDSIHNIMFNNNYYPSIRALAYSMRQNWDQAQVFVKEETLLKWLEIDSQSTQLIKLEKLLKPKIYNNGTNDKDEILIKALRILDQYAPIRLQDCVISLDSLGIFLAYSIAEKINTYIDNVRRIINLSLWNEFLDLEYTDEKSRVLLMHLSRSKYAINKIGIGFGIERCLYELNTNLPCQSPLISENYITKVHDLLICIEQKAGESKTFIIDRHIAAFLASKLGMDQRLNYKHYNEISKKFLDNDAIKILTMLTIAQERYKVSNLINLAKIVVEMLLPILERVGNYKRRQELHNNLNNYASKGNFAKLLNIIGDPAYFERDQKERELAEQQLVIINKQIEKLHDENQCYITGYNLGLKLCVVCSYFACAIMFMVLIMTEF